MKIVQITDTHILEDPHAMFEGCNTRNSFEAVLSYIRSLTDVDLIVGTGDMSMEGGGGSYYQCQVIMMSQMWLLGLLISTF
jgi:3',5'-cyclic-AMP phosphodiesterase